MSAPAKHYISCKLGHPHLHLDAPIRKWADSDTWLEIIVYHIDATGYQFTQWYANMPLGG